MKSTYVPRDIEKELIAATRQFPVLVLTGARQTGKSTLLKHLFPKVAYATLDDPFTRQAAQEDPRSFLTQAPRIVIDEIQHLPGLLPHIKVLVDADRRNAGRFLLTGSQIFPLMAGLGESLAGRAAIYHLQPFSHRELGNPPLSVERCFQRIFNGFYPDVVAHGVDRNRFFSSYVQTYLERDIRLMTAVHDLKLFQNLIGLLAARIGNLLNLNELAKEAGISATTVRRWISLLEATGLVVLLRPYFGNPTKRIVKSPKLYFGDTGLAAWLLRYPTAESLRHGPQSGAFFENLVLLECLKHQANFAAAGELFFYRDSNHNEIDLVVASGSATHLVEIKQTATPKAAHFDAIQRLLPLFPHPQAYAVLASFKEERLSAHLSALPWPQIAARVFPGTAPLH
jgi:uncharacterized protein